MTGSPLDPYAASAAELQERRDVERSGVAFLVYRDGSDRQRLLPLEAGHPRLTVGRGKGSDVLISWDPEVSRVHAQLELVGGDWTVVDDGLSRNGTFLNGERLSGRRRLHDGDELRFGRRTTAVFRLPAPAEAGATKVPDELPPITLSETQRKVLVALCRPFRGGEKFATPATNQQIASELFLSVDAVKGHLRALFAKFSIDELPQNQKRARLVELALDSGTISERELG